MKPVIPHIPTLALAEVLNSASNMVKEIAHYKRAIAELEMQREQMHIQANLMQQQIQAQLTQNLKRIDTLTSGFNNMLEQNKLFINQHTQRELNVQQQSLQLIQLIAQCNDVQQQQNLMQIWQNLNEQMNSNRSQAEILHTQMMAAHQQFGIDITQDNQTFKNVS